MKLSRILDGVQVTKLFQTVYGKMVQTHDVVVRNIRYDSRFSGRDDLFVAIRGTVSDGHRYLHEAIRNGANAIVVEDEATVPDPLCMHEGVIKIVVPDSRAALSSIAANFYGRPSGELSVIGITGTNGKTTTTHLLASIVEAGGGKPGLIGTIEYKIGEEIIPATHTTPESLDVQQLLRKMVAAGCTHAVMEVSSHALIQRRVDDVRFAAGVFTNLTQDHLDYHSDMNDYFRAKQRLFTMLDEDAYAVTNADSEYGLSMVDGIRGRIVTYGSGSGADFRSEHAEVSLRGTKFSVTDGETSVEMETHLIGSFNVSNMLAAFACARSLAFDRQIIKQGLESVRGVRGRFESITSPDGWIAIVDYSHTPDALEHVLRAIHDIKPDGGEIITVFGCGGDRDRTKRPLMGRVAETFSDRVVVTSDNPRTEDPEQILDDIYAGLSGKHRILRIVDRKKAILTALSAAKSGDVVLIAGKGHETYQIIGTQRLHFSDREVVEEFTGKNFSRNFDRI